jgi:hypothetical protein
LDGRGGKEESGDLPDAPILVADRMMDKVYGGHVHQNPGMHLVSGGIEDRHLIVYLPQRYDAPNGLVGKGCLRAL